MMEEESRVLHEKVRLLFLMDGVGRNKGESG